ncbi:MAG: VCBS repeat-containing protein, partial [Polyangiaceae bacterium]
NLCDIPDVVIATAGSGELSKTGHLYMLGGKDGALESTFSDTVIDGDANPAIADLDGDKVPEVIAIDAPGHVLIFDNKGAVKFTGDVSQASSMMHASCSAISVYDLDADGIPEIIYGFEVFDNKGKHKWSMPVSNDEDDYWCPTATAADLDNDGKLELIFGNAAYHSDGSVYWTLPGKPVAAPQVANLDADSDPEILIARQDGILVLENDGTVKFGPVQPFDPGVSPTCWDKPAAIHDFDGDGHADLATSSCSHYGVFKIGATGLTQLWLTPVDDSSGIASSTAFDFLGRGTADAVYGDQNSLLVYDGKNGTNELKQSRSSGTIIEYPIVADVDNDNSADILVVSNNGSYPALQVFQDADKRWIPTRRIWNQHAYHVTNVREDGTIPKVMPKSWQLLNTFRTNAEIENGGTCAPPVVPR